MGETNRVEADGLEIVYDEIGAGTRSFVLVHGYSGCRHDFEAAYPRLAALGRVLIPDLPGHGDSARGEPEAYTLETGVAGLLAFLDALSIERCDLLGHSMGGMLALRLALAHPERVASLVLMNTTPRAPEGLDLDAFALARKVAREAGMETLQKLLQAHLQASPERAAAERRAAEREGERYWEHHRRRFHRMDPEAYARLGDAMLAQPSLEPRLGEIRCPTLVMVGEEDVHFRAPAETLAAAIPDAELIVLPDAEHHPQRENTEAWLAALRAHLARARRG